MNRAIVDVFCDQAFCFSRIGERNGEGTSIILSGKPLSAVEDLSGSSNGIDSCCGLKGID